MRRLCGRPAPSGAISSISSQTSRTTSAGNGGSAAMSIVATWMVATKLTPAQFGAFALALAIMTVLQEIGGPSLDIAIVRFAASHSRSDPLRAEAYLGTG